MGIHRRQALYASVIRACRSCGAPGFWHNTPGVNVGCYAPDRVTKLGTDWVGPTCPNCGANGQPVEDRGLIWQKLFGPWWATALEQVKATVRRLRS